VIYAILITGIILGLIIRAAIKAFSTGYGNANDLFDQPVLIKSCYYCNQRVPKNYTKNLCPTCHKPLE
jgi:Zn finger protein HypA/HybF involved in hydrogenase expression